LLRRAKEKMNPFVCLAYFAVKTKTFQPQKTQGSKRHSFFYSCSTRSLAAKISTDEQGSISALLASIFCFFLKICLFYGHSSQRLKSMVGTPTTGPAR
jgi:hypothetical protein